LLAAGIISGTTASLAILLWFGYVQPDAPAPHVPLWFLPLLPALAGMAASGLPGRTQLLTLLALGVTTAATVTIGRLVQVVPDLGCPPRTLGDEVPSAIQIGLIAGLGMSSGAWLAARIAASGGSWRRTLATVAGSGVAAITIAICAVLQFRLCGA
jgi:hypothetical protein